MDQAALQRVTVISGILAGGSLVSAWCFCCFTRLLVWPGDFVVFRLFLMPYQVEMIQCYHLLHELAHELAPVTPRSGVFGLCCCVLFCVGWLAFVFGAWLFSVLVVTS